MLRHIFCSVHIKHTLPNGGGTSQIPYSEGNRKIAVHIVECISGDYKATIEFCQKVCTKFFKASSLNVFRSTKQGNFASGNLLFYADHKLRKEFSDTQPQLCTIIFPHLRSSGYFVLIACTRTRTGIARFSIRRVDVNYQLALFLRVV